ncbi:uncharacterized protein LOC110424274 [Herrania umbratica]|uniref:Uncharacterized protein LOC110424274 n=1 Tax=Herrania umbratica TaxID=108875 RepID=A0A6J1B5M7_9ROSI|nr:uncharacterized protein LOC110424274 [Herrania umbratica]
MLRKSRFSSMAVLERLARTARSWRRIPYLKTLIPSRAPLREVDRSEYFLVGAIGAGAGFVGALVLVAPSANEEMVAQYAKKLSESELNELREVARVTSLPSISGTDIFDVPYMYGRDILSMCQQAKRARLIREQAANNGGVQKECHESKKAST